MFTHTITRLVAAGSSQLGASFSVQAGAESNIDESIPVGADLAVAFAAIAAKIASFALLSTLADVTVETNSSSSPINVFTLKKGIPFIWTNQDGTVLKDTAGTNVANITSLFVTNASVDVTVLQIRALIDPT